MADVKTPPAYTESHSPSANDTARTTLQRTPSIADSISPSLALPAYTETASSEHHYDVSTNPPSIQRSHSMAASVNSVTTTSEPPAYDFVEDLTPQEKSEIVASERSVRSLSTTTSNTETISPSSSHGPTAITRFTPGRRLMINANGIGLIRFPLPSSELEIPIYTLDGQLAFKSIRHRKSSGNAILTDASHKPLVRTTYFFGPGTDPEMSLSLNDREEVVRTTSKWTSRSHRFEVNDTEYEWSYVSEVLPPELHSTLQDVQEFDEKGKDKEREKCNEKKQSKKTLLVLTRIPSGDGFDREPVRVAVLIRTKSTRPGRSTKTSAGNGGELVIAQGSTLAESVVVASCLLMLKKEVDRRRTAQILIMAGIAGGGAG